MLLVRSVREFLGAKFQAVAVCLHDATGFHIVLPDQGIYASVSNLNCAWGAGMWSPGTESKAVGTFSRKDAMS
jgi:hypothetical protein